MLTFTLKVNMILFEGMVYSTTTINHEIRQTVLHSLGFGWCVDAC
jgi:hypothetical protein